MAAKTLWTVEDVALFVGMSVGWVYARTAPNTRFKPKIPRVANVSYPRFDPDVVRALFSNTPETHQVSSLKIEKMGNLHSANTSSSRNGKRRFEKL